MSTSTQPHTTQQHHQPSIVPPTHSSVTTMVYFDHRKRRGRKDASKPSKSGTTITDLPDELLLKILDDLPTADILSIRALCHTLLPACTDALQHRLKVIYIHPRPSSIKKAVAICNSGLASKVEVVCLLGYVDWQAMLKKWSNARYHSRDQGTAYEQITFRSWPHKTPDTATTSTVNKGRNLRSSRETFSSSYAILLEALAKLPDIRVLRFHDRCDQPGFNQLSDAHIRGSAAPSATSQPFKNERLKSGIHVTVATDADAVFGVLREFGCFTTLEIKEELPFSHLGRSKRLGTNLGRLTALELHCSAGWQVSQWQSTCSKILKKTPLLENLCLKFQHNSAIRDARADTSLRVILDKAKLLALKRLELVALLPLPEEGRNWRPLLQIFDLAEFLKGHSNLVNVKLDNVVCWEGTMLNDTAAAFLRPLQATSQGTTVQWLVNRFQRDPRCKKEHTVNGHTCRHDCFRYFPVLFGDLRLADLDSYMARLDTDSEGEPGHERLFWDVGSVRKQLQS